LTHGVALVRI